MFAPKTDSIRLFVGGGVRRGGKGRCIVWITDKNFSVFRIGRGRFLSAAVPLRRLFSFFLFFRSLFYTIYRISGFSVLVFFDKKAEFLKKQAAPRFFAGRQKKTAAKSGGKIIVSDFLRSLLQAEVPPRRGQRKGFLSAVPLRRRGRGRGRGAFLPSTRRARPSRPPLSSCGA